MQLIPQFPDRSIWVTFPFSFTGICLSLWVMPLSVTSSLKASRPSKSPIFGRNLEESINGWQTAKSNQHDLISPLLCVVCFQGPETTDHLWVHCPLSPRRLLAFIYMGPSRKCFSVCLSIESILPKRNSSLWGLFLHGLMWTMGLERNRRAFKHSYLLLEEVRLYFAHLRCLGQKLNTF